MEGRARRSHQAKAGDLVVIDFEGKVDGTPFEGGKGEDMSVELGSGQLIPGFEDGLLGAKAGDEREIAVTFPADYPSDQVKGKPATFDVTVKTVQTAGKSKVDKDFAKSLGLQNLEQLRGLIRDQQQQELNDLTRTHMKRQLLDQLAARHDFPVPQSMVDAEFQNIMNQLRHEASHEDDQAAALAEIEGDAPEYRHIAERRVRLGLLLSEIGTANGVAVSEQEMNRLIGQAASQYQGKDRERFIRYVQQEPMAAAQLRAPLYEDKVVDFLFSKADISRAHRRPAPSSKPTSRARRAMCTARIAATTMRRRPSRRRPRLPRPKAEAPAKGPVEAKEAEAAKAKPAKKPAPAKKARPQKRRRQRRNNRHSRERGNPAIVRRTLKT